MYYSLEAEYAEIMEKIFVSLPPNYFRQHFAFFPFLVVPHIALVYNRFKHLRGEKSQTIHT